MKTFDEIFQVMGQWDLKGRTTEKTEDLTYELKKVVQNIKTMDLESLGDFADLENLRRNLIGALDRVKEMEIIGFARERVHDTKRQIFSALNIPSQHEVDRLARKLSRLEKKVKAIRDRRTVK